VYFEVLSYACVLTAAMVVYPDHGPEPDHVIQLVQQELDSIVVSPQ
jgi:hypothetical protein